MSSNLWTAFVADDGSNEILTASLPEGGSWTGNAPTYQTTPFSPAMAYFNKTLYVAFITDDEDSATGVPSNRIFLCSTTDGVTWNPATFFNHHSKCSPSLAVWNGSLHIAFVANDSTDILFVYHSSNPVDASSWSETVATNQSSANAPSLAAYPASGPDSKLYMAFVAKSGSQDILIYSLAVNGAWTQGPSTKQTCQFSPSLAAGDDLYLVFAASNPSNDLYLCSLLGNGSWSSAIPVNQSTSATPCATAFGSGLSVGFLAHGPSGVVLVSSSASPTTSWTGGNVDIKQQSSAGPAIVAAPISYAPVSPGPNGARINYLITNHTLTDPLENITVTIVAIQDLVCTATYAGKNYEPVGSPVSPGGFSFQLNCQPPGTISGTGPYPAHGKNVWGQYGISVDGTQFSVWSENSLNGGLGPVTSQNVFTLPKANTIPQGYKIEIKLVTDPSSKKVTQVGVNAWDENGHAIKGGWGSSPVPGPWLSEINLNLAPMLNLQFNIGGPDNGEYSKFKADTPSFPLLSISYKADHPLMVRGATNPETAENADLSYSLLSEYPANPIIQYCLHS